MSCLDYSGVPSVDKIDGQFATAHGLPVTIVIETDEQGNTVLVNSAQVHTLTLTHMRTLTHTHSWTAQVPLDRTSSKWQLCLAENVHYWHVYCSFPECLRKKERKPLLTTLR